MELLHHRNEVIQ